MICELNHFIVDIMFFDRRLILRLFLIISLFFDDVGFKLCWSVNFLLSVTFSVYFPIYNDNTIITMVIFEYFPSWYYC